MNWDRAKKYTIIFLFTLNLLLFGINMWMDYTKRLTPQQKQDVVDMLAQNNISVKCDLPEKHYTASQLVLRKIDFDYLKLQKIFFENKQDLKRVDTPDKVRIFNNNEALTIESNHIEYKADNVSVNDTKQAVKLADAMVKDIHGYFGSFYRYDSKETDKQYLFYYTEKVSGLKLYNNIVSVAINKDGGVRLGLSYYQAGEHYGGRANIIPCDEALFSVMRCIQQNAVKKPAIKNIELCYYLNEMVGDEGVALPCYRVEVYGDEDSGGIYYINGYSGEIVN